jgi:hypothetical protein
MAELDSGIEPATRSSVGNRNVSARADARALSFEMPSLVPVDLQTDVSRGKRIPCAYFASRELVEDMVGCESP